MKATIIIASIIALTGCSTTEFTSTSGWSYKSSRPVGAKLEVGSVSIRHQEGGDTIIEMEGLNHNQTAAAIDSTKDLVQAVGSLQTP